MAKKQRLEIHLDPPVLAWLRREAARLSVSMGEVVRKALEKAAGDAAMETR